MALTALLKRNHVAHVALMVTLGIFGAALFFGDGIITPAISVLGALQGLRVATPSLAHLVLPISVAILIGLFVLQQFGSGRIGWLFGPVMLIWFTTIGLLGLGQVVKDPGVFQALSPQLGYPVPLRPRSRRVSDARGGGAGRHRRRGAVRRPRALRSLGDSPRLVRRRAASPDPQLPRSVGLDPPPPVLDARHELVQSVLLDGPRLGPMAGADPRHVRDHHRVSGGDLGDVLGSQAGRAARVPAPAEDPLHLGDGGADLRTRRQLGVVRRRRRRSRSCSAPRTG